ncbi:MAG: 5-formyltetrahydrofolate cyclo-ligase [Bacteroidaceae bacterium]|nr:5-formyltetrahydrofolate cyclo-ligase [Bacteroidaceae bacterium]
MMKKREEKLVAPGGVEKVLLHTCCAPCSGAIIEAMLNSGIEPVIYYCNPNIYPLEEYEIRKNECSRYAEKLGLQIVDADNDHSAWLECVKGLESEPERGARCLRCFSMRLAACAEYAAANGFTVFTTTLDSSRWKSHDQIVEAGNYAASLYENITYWDYNWRKGGLTARRAEIIKENNFYNQRYCGCEFSIGHLKESKQTIRKAVRERISGMNDSDKRDESLFLTTYLYNMPLVQKSEKILLYYPMADEIDISDAIIELAADKKIYLPSIEGDDIVVRRYENQNDLRTGRYGILEPAGAVLENPEEIDLVVVPGRAFDIRGYRLGRGKGYYDRLLPKMRAVKIGVCFDCQYMFRVPTDEYDVPMDYVVCRKLTKE